MALSQHKGAGRWALGRCAGVLGRGAGQARGGLEHYGKGVKDLKEAIRLEPNNKEIRNVRDCFLRVFASFRVYCAVLLSFEHESSSHCIAPRCVIRFAIGRLVACNFFGGQAKRHVHKIA